MDHFKNCLVEVKSGQPEDPLAYHLQTVMHLIMLAESSSKEKILDKKFSLKDSKVID